MNTGMHLLSLILFKQDFIEMWPGAGLTLEEDGGPIDRVLIKRVLWERQLSNRTDQQKYPTIIVDSYTNMSRMYHKETFLQICR